MRINMDKVVLLSRMGGGQDRHVIQMIANASLDVVEDVMRKENGM